MPRLLDPNRRRPERPANPVTAAIMGGPEGGWHKETAGHDSRDAAARHQTRTLRRYTAYHRRQSAAKPAPAVFPVPCSWRRPLRSTPPSPPWYRPRPGRPRGRSRQPQPPRPPGFRSTPTLGLAVSRSGSGSPSRRSGSRSRPARSPGATRCPPRRSARCLGPTSIGCGRRRGSAAACCRCGSGVTGSISSATPTPWPPGFTSWPGRWKRRGRRPPTAVQRWPSPRSKLARSFRPTARAANSGWRHPRNPAPAACRKAGSCAGSPT
jgi:hypothetical protein